MLSAKITSTIALIQTLIDKVDEVTTKLSTLSTFLDTV